jgi:Fe-Mn family superoxide dismutase
MSVEFSPLPYAIDALSPHLSEKTLLLHHGKHHRGYVAKLNELIEGSLYEVLSLEDIILQTQDKPEARAIFNNAAQHFNHSLFWVSMKPGGGPMPNELERRIIADFGSVEAFKSEFVAKGMGQFRSGWVWLVEGSDRLQIVATSNAATPIMAGAQPLLVCDVWEHAYYVDYENRRLEFLEAFVECLADGEAALARSKAMAL